MKTLPHVKPSDYPFVSEQDPMDPRGELPEPVQFRQVAHAQPGAEQQTQVEQFAAEGAVRTALTIEPRDGVLCVFMPPTPKLDDYLELLGTVEAIAREKKLPIRIEGYTPRLDPRVDCVKVIPDPGVVEVDIHPAASWRQAVETTTALYEDARQSRLGTDKFMADGRHTGTGGGNHVVLGGVTPANSPFLRRPDLLASLILYWQRHPALSYLFSGLFLGPTGQGPRAPRRSARRPALRIGDRAFADAGAGRSGAVVARRPALSQSSHRRYRQHPSRRDLHRQTLFAGQRDRAAGPRWNFARSKCRPTRA